MDIKKINKQIVNDFDCESIDFSSYEDDFLAIYLLNYEIDIFSDVFSQLSKSKKMGINKADLIDDYIITFKSLRKIIKQLISSINNSKTKILFNESFVQKAPSFLALSSLYSEADSFPINLKKIILNSLNRQLLKTNEAIYLYEKHSCYYLYEETHILNRNFNLRWEDEILLYKNFFISHIGHHRFGLHSSSNYTFVNLNTIINIHSFLNCRPSFIETNNFNFNDKLANIYAEFDILDMIKLRNKKYFSNGENDITFMEPTIFKLNRKFKHTIIPECIHEGLLDLYQSALKQIEPLPRCVFLYRMVEYAINNHYQTIFSPDEIKHKDVINFYISQALTHRYIPIYFIDYGFVSDIKTGNKTRKRKISMRDFTKVLKNESKKIIEEWKNTSYLSNKCVGEIVYNTGRNKVAHGGNGDYNSKYDLSKNYLHINNVNIILELISRYLIELLYPELSKVVEKSKKLYILNTQDKNAFGVSQNV